MADKQQRAVVGLHRLLDPLPGVDVQVVGGLVQDQEVDLVVHQHAQPQAALLPAGEHRHRLEHVLAPEVVCRQSVSGRLGREALFRRHHILHQVPVRVVEADDLGQVCLLHLGAGFDAAVVRIQLPHDHLDKSGLSGAVVADEGDALAPLHLQADALKEVLVPVGLGHVPDAQHLVPVELRGGEPGVHLPRLGGFGGGPHPLDAPFHGDGPAVGLVHAHESPDPQLLRRLLQLCDLGLLFFVLLHPLLVATFLLHGVEAVIPAVKLRFPVLDLDDPGDGAVQEIPVVGDGDHRAVERANVLLQPLGCVEVQVVGGLVQQQDVRVLQDEAAQVHPGLFPAGEAVEQLGPLAVRNGQAVCDLVHRHVRVIAAEGLEPLAEGAVPLQNRRVALPGGHPGLQGPHLLRQAL